MVVILRTVLDSLARVFSNRFDGVEFVEHLSQNESGKALIEALKKDYLNKNNFPTQTNIEDATWDVVYTIYSPQVTIADPVLGKIGGDTHPDAKSLAISDLKTFYGYLMGLIGNGIGLKVTPKQTPEEIEKEKGEVQMAYADDREKVKLLEGKLSEEELGKMVQEIDEDSNYFPELKVYQNDEDFFNETFNNSPWEAVSKANLEEWNFQDDLAAFSNDGHLRSYSESEYGTELKTYETDIPMSYLNLLESGQGELRDKVEELLKEELQGLFQHKHKQKTTKQNAPCKRPVRPAFCSIMRGDQTMSTMTDTALEAVIKDNTGNVKDVEDLSDIAINLSAWISVVGEENIEFEIKNMDDLEAKFPFIVSKLSQFAEGKSWNELVSFSEKIYDIMQEDECVSQEMNN